MSKITINLDTESKDCSLIVDGKTYSGIRDVSIYKEYGEDYGSDNDYISFRAILKNEKIGDISSQTMLTSYANLDKKDKVIEKIGDDLVIVQRSSQAQKKELKLKKHWAYT